MSADLDNSGKFEVALNKWRARVGSGSMAVDGDVAKVLRGHIERGIESLSMRDGDSLLFSALLGTESPWGALCRDGGIAEVFDSFGDSNTAWGRAIAEWESKIGPRVHGWEATKIWAERTMELASSIVSQHMSSVVEGHGGAYAGRREDSESLSEWLNYTVCDILTSEESIAMGVNNLQLDGNLYHVPYMTLQTYCLRLAAVADGCVSGSGRRFHGEGISDMGLSQIGAYRDVLVRVYGEVIFTADISIDDVSGQPSSGGSGWRHWQFRADCESLLNAVRSAK